MKWDHGTRMSHGNGSVNGSGGTPPVSPPSGNSPPGGFFDGSVPPKQAAPPNEPPVDEGGGGDNDPFRGGFPPIPPHTFHGPRQPFTVLDTSLIHPGSPMYLACMLAGWRGNANPMHPCCPPPAALGFYLYVVQHVEVQTRQFFRPPGPFLSITGGDEPDHCPEEYRKLNWKANVPVQCRQPVIVFPQNGEFMAYPGDGILDLPACRWKLIVSESSIQALTGGMAATPAFRVYETMMAMRQVFLTPHPAAPLHIRGLYEQAEIPGVVPTYCITGNYDPNVNPYQLPQVPGGYDYYTWEPEDDEDDLDDEPY